MKEPICPLCLSVKLEISEKLLTADLSNLYSKSVGQSIRDEFGTHNEIFLYRCSECDLRFFYPPTPGSEDFYNLLQGFNWYYQEEKNEFDFASGYVRPNDKVLEVGSGRGAFQKKLKCAQYVGLELSPRAISMAKDEDVHLLNETIESHCKNNSGRYDIVCAFQVLEHVANIRSFIESSLFCLKPGGLLIYSVPSWDSFSAYVINFLLDLPPHHISKWSDQCLRNIGRIFRLEEVEIWHEPLQEIHRGFYTQTILMHSISRFLRKKSGLLDLSLGMKILSYLCWHVGKLFSNGLSNEKLLPRGISVTGVFRKSAG